MTQGLITKQTVQDIADAIRRKTDEAGTAGATPLVTKEISENGTYRASDDDAFGYSHVIVDVEGESATLVQKSITENGTYDPSDDSADGYSQVTVNVETGTELTSEDEGKVVVEDDGSYVLATQTSLSVSSNGTYDTTTNDEVVVNVSDGGGGAVSEVVPEEKYILDFTATMNANQARSAGFEFSSMIDISVSKIRVFPRSNLVNAYITQGSTTIVSVTNVQVTVGEWNDVILDSPVTLKRNTHYVVWYTHPDGTALRYKGSSTSSTIPYITNHGTKYSTSSDTIPMNSESGTTYGVDLYVDGYIATREAVLRSKTITQNGTYDPSEDNADGYSQVTVNVAGGDGGTAYDQTSLESYILTDFTPNENSRTAKSTGFEFYSDKLIVVSKIRVFARSTSVSAYINKGNEVVASVTNAQVTAGQWNDLNLDNPVTLENGVHYVVWYTHTDGTASRHIAQDVPSQIWFVHKVSTVYDTSTNLLPTTVESGASYGINLYVDSYLTEYGTTLVAKTITENGTYDPSDDNADGYSQVTVNVPSSGGGTIPDNDILFHFDEDMLNRGSVQAAVYSANNRYSLSGEQSKFGQYSLKVTSVSNFADGLVALQNDFEFGDDDFTIDFWEYSTKNSGAPVVFTYRSLGFWTRSTTFEIAITSNPSSWDYDVTTTVANINSAWHHVAICRDGQTLYGFLDGNLVRSIDIGDLVVAPTKAMCIGYGSWGGYISELRVKRGEAVWTENFTPPTEPYEDTTGGGASGFTHAYPTTSQSFTLSGTPTATATLN